MNGNDTYINAIKSIGQSLINRAEDICNDLNKVSSITIYANINPTEIINFDITKNYYAFDDYLVEKNKKTIENFIK